MLLNDKDVILCVLCESYYIHDSCNLIKIKELTGDHLPVTPAGSSSLCTEIKAKNH